MYAPSRKGCRHAKLRHVCPTRVFLSRSRPGEGGGKVNVEGIAMIGAVDIGPITMKINNAYRSYVKKEKLTPIYDRLWCPVFDL